MQTTESASYHLHINLEEGDIVIDTTPEERFDKLTRIARHTFQVPIALICLRDKGQLWLKSHQGLPIENIHSFSEHISCRVINSNDDDKLIYISDTRLMNAFCDHSCVRDCEEIRFYAGVPINIKHKKIGMLCLMDNKPRVFSEEDLKVLHDLAFCIQTEFKQIQKKQLIQEFRKQRKHLRAVLDTIVDGIVTIDGKGIIQTVNHATVQMFGYLPVEMIGNNIKMLMPAPFCNEHDSYLKNYMNTHQAKIIGIGREVVGKRKNGDIFPMNLAVGVMGSNGDSQFVGIVRDISEQHKTYLALEQFKYTLDHTVDCVFLCRIDNLRFVYVNEGAKRQVGYSEDELLCMSVIDIKPEFNFERYKHLIAPLLSDARKSQTFETVHRHKNGKDIPVEVTQQIIQQKGQEPRLLTIVRDISERKEVERMKNQFVSTVSHELRTPLTSIRGALGLVLGGALGEIPEKMQSILTMANRNSERLTLLINDLLDLEKMESEQLVFTFERVDLITVVRHALEANQGYANTYAVSLQLHAPKEPAWVHADSHRLLQVLANLLSNACKFSHHGGIVDVYVLQQDDDYKVVVQDYGNGVRKTFRPRIFERFAQADAADNRQKGGSGLGLSISKVIMERHGGKIDFESIEGEGSSFFFTLPRFEKKTIVSEQAVQQIAETITPLQPLPFSHKQQEDYLIEPLCMVLCKDNKSSLNLTQLLNQEGVAYDVSHDFEQAKLLLARKKYSLLIVDLSLSESKNMSFIHELNQSTHNNLNIIITSLTDEDVDIEIDALITEVAIDQCALQPVGRAGLHSALQLALCGHFKATLLHVEDDLDIIDLVSRILSNADVDYYSARSLREARQLLKEHFFDLIILDLELPDGAGTELLNELNSHSKVIIFSGYNTSQNINQQVSAALVKSTTNNEQLLESIRRVLSTQKQGSY